MAVIFYAYVERYGKADNLRSKIRYANKQNLSLRYTNKNISVKSRSSLRSIQLQAQKRNTLFSDCKIRELDWDKSKLLDSDNENLGDFSDCKSLTDKVKYVLENNEMKEYWRDRWIVFKEIYCIPLM